MERATTAAEPPGLFDGVLARGPVRDAVSDQAWLQAMLDVEAALARAGAKAGLLSADDAEVIAAACRADDFDARAIGTEAAGSGNPVVPLVRELVGAVDGPAAGHVHRGATSQDILDTAAMLVATRALEGLLEDLEGVASAAATLAEDHRDTLLAGRTLLQHALPVTFGLKAAGWLAAVDEALARLAEVRQSRLAVQLGGAAGTLAALDGRGLEVLSHLARELDLAEPVLPWHSSRNRVVELAAALGEAAAVAQKIAGDVILLAQTDVGEVTEAASTGHGGSSTLPHKRNPIAAVSAIGCAAQAPGLVATLFANAGRQEHERAAGAWHAEWRPLAELLRATGSAVSWLRECLERLEVHPARMRANLDRTQGLIVAEQVASALAPALGRLAAHDLVRAACDQAVSSGAPLADVLGNNPSIGAHLDRDEISKLLDPATAVGSAGPLVDRALQTHRDRLARPRR